MKLLFALGLSAFLVSCSILHLINVKKEKNESIYEVNAFLKKKKYTYDESLFLNDSLHFLRKTSGYIHSDLSKIVSYIEVRIFDSSGANYTSFSQCHNDFAKKGFVSEIPIRLNSQQLYINNTLSLKNELVLFDINFAQKQSIETFAKNYKYTIVVYYTIWTNHFSEKVLKELSKFKKKYPNEVYLILANSAMDKVSDPL